MHGPSGLPRFFVESAPDEGQVALGHEESLHAQRVLRLEEGSSIEVLDGQGARWTCRLTSLNKRGSLAKVVEGPFLDPAPGAPEAPLPWIEVAVAWPRKSRGEDMLGPLVQLGAAAIRPLIARFSGDKTPPEEVPERWHKLVREASKQCGRTHLPRFEPVQTVEAFSGSLEGAATAVLEAGIPLSLDTWLRSLPSLGEGRAGTCSRPIRLVIGPEGGFAPEEIAAFQAAGASQVCLGPHVLRVEVAALSAMAVAATALSNTNKPPSPNPKS